MIQIVSGKMLFEHNYNQVLHNNLFIWILLIFFLFLSTSHEVQFYSIFHGSKCKVKKIFSNFERALNCLDYEPNEKFSF